MANTIFKLRRSSVAGKVPNTSTVAIGELAINLTDRILYSSDGSAVFEIGANNTNVNISNNLIIANVTTANTSGLYSTKQLYGNTLTVATNTFTVGNTFYIVSNGNVGIGTGNNFNWDNSTTFLTIGSLLLTGSGVTDGAGSGIEIGQWRTGNGAAYIDFHSAYGNDLDARIIKASGANGTFSIQNGANGAISIDTSSVNRVFVSGNGNIGIGNSTPEHKLRVQGTASVTGNLSLETTSGLILANGVGVSLNGSLGVNGQVLATNGSSAYWFTPIGGVLPIQQQYTANGSATSFVVTGGYVPNTISVFLNGVMLRNGTEVDVTSGSTFTISPAPANGSLIDVVGPSRLYSTGVNSIVSQQFTANGTANSFAVTGGYISNSVLVFLNGVKQIPGTDVDISTGANVGFYSTPSNGFVVDVYGYQTYVALGSNAITVGSNLSIGADSITVGNSTVNTYITAGNIALNGSELRIGNSSVNTVINNISASLGTNTFTIGNTFYIVSNGNVGIACTSPDFKLDVHGSSSGLAASFEYDVGAGDCGIRIVGMRQGSDGDVSYLDLTNYNYSTPNTYVMGRISSGMDGSSGAGAANGNIKFKTSLNGTLTEAMRIGANGNVGISNATPADKLSVNGTTYLGGNTVITGNLIVTGTTVTVNTTTLDVKDLNITIAKGAGSAAAANGAGITVDTGYANLYYDSSANAWMSTVALYASGANNFIRAGTAGQGSVTAIAGYSNSGGGVYGTSVSQSGISGISNSGYGVYGQSNTTWGGYFIATGIGAGVVGIANTNLGVYGVSDSYFGVQGISNTNHGGVFSSTSAYGVAGSSVSGIGLYGSSNSSIGAHGISNVSYGVYGVSNTSIGVIGTSVSNWGGYFVGAYPLYAANSSTEMFRVNVDGRVGIGTSAPTSKLSIGVTGAESYDTHFSINCSNATGGQVMSSVLFGGVVKSRIRTDYIGNMVITPMTGQMFYGYDSANTTGVVHNFYANNTTQTMIISGAGNVGIKTASPLARLDLGDITTANTPMAILARPYGGDGTFCLTTGTGSGINVEDEYCRLSLKYGGSGTSYHNAGIGFHRGSTTTGGWLTFNVNDWTEAMRIASSGRVSIGTTTSDSKLLVSGGALGNFRLFYDGSSQNFFDVDTHIFRNANASSEYLRINSSGHVLPGGDNTQNLGSTTNRWANIYTGDLNLSNEGSGGNDVDGTTGSWTIQEGENDLYIINKKNGKKFKIKMEEIV